MTLLNRGGSAVTDALDDVIATVTAQAGIDAISGLATRQVIVVVMRRLAEVGWEAGDERLRLIAIRCVTEPDEARLHERVSALQRAFADLLTRSLAGPRRKRLTEDHTATMAAALTSALLLPGPLRAMWLAPSPSPPADTARVAAPTEPSESVLDVEHRVTELERTFEHHQPTSERALQAAIDLFALGPGSTWVFGRMRRRAEILLAEPDVRTSALGARAWIAAAEMLSMADGDRALADEVASVTLQMQRIGADPASVIGAIRTAWLLTRLDRFEEALEQLERCRGAAARAGLGDHVAMADAVDAHARCSVGSLERAVSVGQRAAAPDRDTPVARLARDWGGSAVIRAHLLGDDPDAALRMSRSLPHNDLHLDLGGVMLVLARGLLDLAHGRASAAVSSLVRVREHHRRIGMENLAGWPWLEGMVAGLVALDRTAEAQQLLAEVRTPVLVWATPTLLAQLQRAHAMLSTSVGERERAMAEAARLLAESPAQVDRARTAQLARRLRTVVDRAALTHRVREVAQLAATGMSNAQIAVALGIASSTVARHMSAALRATGAQNRTELARLLSTDAVAAPGGTTQK